MTPQDPWATPPDGSTPSGGTGPAEPINTDPIAAPPTVSPGYAQMPPAVYGTPVATQKDWMGITSLVLSLTTLVFGVTWIGGVIFGHLGLAAAKRGEASNRGVALAGTIIGWVLGGLSIVIVVGWILFIASASIWAG